MYMCMEDKVHALDRVGLDDDVDMDSDGDYANEDDEEIRQRLPRHCSCHHQLGVNT